MLILPSWRRLRNIALLIITALSLVLGFRAAHLAPLNWLWVLPLAYGAYVVWTSFWFTHPLRMRNWFPKGPVFASPVHEKALFKSRDGLTLFGWFIPGRNRAAVILVHGLGSSGLTLSVYAAPLVSAGYNVLLMDLRAHGSSDGDTSTYGVLEAHDVAGAVDYLLARGEVDPDKIGVFGISLGAQAAFRGALHTPAIRALVLEGLGPADIQDRVSPAPPEDRANKGLMLWRRLLYTSLCFEQWVFNAFSGQHPTPLIAEIGKLMPRDARRDVACPILLIACGKAEITFNRRLCAIAAQVAATEESLCTTESGATEPLCALWELPDAHHAGALEHAPHEYPRRIVAFFDRALFSRVLGDAPQRAS